MIVEIQQDIILCEEILIWKSERVCNFEDCKKGACYNYVGDKRRRFCFTHKLDNMVNVASKRCEHEDCDKIPTYNLEGEKTNKFCKNHKLPDMISRHTSCEFENCKIRPHYNNKGITNPKFCVIHKSTDMINVVTKTCEFENCEIRPTYNYNGKKRAKLCKIHKKENMVNVISKYCESENCKLLASFNFEGLKNPRFCNQHKQSNMIYTKIKKCEFDKCDKLPRYNFGGEKGGKYCAIHKYPEMVLNVSKRCEFEGCNLIPNYNLRGEKIGRFCVSHKSEKMIDVKHTVCKTPLCDIRVQEKYEGYCVRCFMYTFPDKPIAKNYKSKETAVVEYIKTEFPNFTWIADKKVQDGCSKKRPDLLLDLGDQVVIVEVDENQHTDYDCSCENKRLMELSQDLQHRPIVFIRFNPDSYTNEKGEKVRSCWSVTKETGIIKIANKKEWNQRLENLKNQVVYWSNNKTDKMVEVVHLYFG